MTTILKQMIRMMKQMARRDRMEGYISEWVSSGPYLAKSFSPCKTMHSRVARMIARIATLWQHHWEIFDHHHQNIPILIRAQKRQKMLDWQSWLNHKALLHHWLARLKEIEPFHKWWNKNSPDSSKISKSHVLTTGVTGTGEMTATKSFWEVFGHLHLKALQCSKEYILHWTKNLISPQSHFDKFQWFCSKQRAGGGASWSFHLEAHCTDQAALARPTLILTGFNGFAAQEGGGRGRCMSTRDVARPWCLHELGKNLRRPWRAEEGRAECRLLKQLLQLPPLQLPPPPLPTTPQRAG